MPFSSLSALSLAYSRLDSSQRALGLLHCVRDIVHHPKFTSKEAFNDGVTQLRKQFLHLHPKDDFALTCAYSCIGDENFSFVEKNKVLAHVRKAKNHIEQSASVFAHHLSSLLPKGGTALFFDEGRLFSLTLPFVDASEKHCSFVTSDTVLNETVRNNSKSKIDFLPLENHSSVDVLFLSSSLVNERGCFLSEGAALALEKAKEHNVPVHLFVSKYSCDLFSMKHNSVLGTPVSFEEFTYCVSEEGPCLPKLFFEEMRNSTL